MKKHSYTAASELPVKLLRCASVAEGLDDGRIPPVHIQFIPTNRCNLACSFCSCAERTRSDEMSLDEALDVIWHFARLGTKAVTITGGGEPLLHPDLPAIVSEFAANDIQMGLVTNGCLLPKVSLSMLRKLTWCRISASDEREMPDLASTVEAVATDWAFSYVLSSEPNIENLERHLRFAEEHDFTHVRIVSDLLSPDSVPIDQVRKQVDSPLAIWQGRKEWTRGAKECRISQLKPVIGANGQVYPCCGVQYAHAKADLDLPASMSMGHWRDFGERFSGSQCARCYYDDYNKVLAMMDSDIDHLDFL